MPEAIFGRADLVSKKPAEAGWSGRLVRRV
jgi:hypothetical protein